MKNLNAVYSLRNMRRRYEVWFLRLGLADGSGAWWFRYLLLNLGRQGCPGKAAGMPVQVWATWFPRDGGPLTIIQGFPVEELRLSDRRENEFHFGVGDCGIDQDSCCGSIEADGHRVTWSLRCRSNFGFTLSDKGWIGFSRTPHSDARFSGVISFEDRRFAGDPLGTGVQGHNCGYRHRNQWTWTHAYFDQPGGASTVEALTYEMPLGLRFRKAMLWHRGRAYSFGTFREKVRDLEPLRWEFEGRDAQAAELRVTVDGAGSALHRLPYLKTDCSGTFQVTNNSLAKAQVFFRAEGTSEELNTSNGAVLEMAG